MRAALAAFLAASALAFAQPAAAQTFTPAARLGSLTLDLDTQEGTFSQWRLNDLCGVNAMRATVSAPRLGVHQRWAPAITFKVSTATDDAVLQFSAPDRQPPLQVKVLRFDGRQRAQEATLPVTLAADGVMEVGFDWDSGGRVTITAGGAQHVIQLSGAPTAFAISNSTGEARIDPLRLGYVGAQPGCPLAD